MAWRHQLSDDLDEDFNDDHGQNVEQMEANVNEVGRIIGTYFQNLQEVFTRKEAFILVKDWHESFWHAAHTPPDDFFGFWGDDDDDDDDNAD